MVKNMNKGFTLIELLGVVALLALILLVAIPSLIDSNKVSNENSKKAFENTVAEACVNYLEVNSESSDVNIQKLFNDGTVYIFSIRDKLVLNGYLKSSLEDPYKSNTQIGTSGYTGQVKATFVSDIVSCDYVK